MKELFNKITELFRKNGFTNLNNASDEKKLLYLYSFYHYYYGNEDSLEEINEHCKFSKQFQNFAQGVFEEDELQAKKVDILIPYYVLDDKKISIEEIEFRISQTSSMVNKVKNKYYDSTEIESLLTEYWDPKSNDELVLKVITNYEPTFDEKIEIKEIVHNMRTIDTRISFDIVFGEDILDEISQLTSNRKNVEYGQLILDKEDNYLVYGEEQSIIANIKASSIRDNYIKFGKAGLFAMNLRFYVPDKKVDVGIEDTIKNKGDKFWYFNNGLIIVCDDFSIKNDIVSLKRFSIVNGGQTTRMIGVIPFEEDFVVPCKIIKNKYQHDLENNFKFVSEIAEASNTQKPIKSSDIIANRPEQRILKAKLADIGIFMQIKRGDILPSDLKKNYPYPWQKDKNSEIGQLIYATICQKPGTARNSKDKIFSNKEKYNAVFGDLNYDMNLIKDLLFIKNHFKKWSNLVKKDQYAPEKKKGLVKNGFFFFAAALMLMAKFAFSKELTEYLIKVGIKSEQGKFVISQRTFNHRIFNGTYESIQPKIFDLFNLIYEKYILKEFDRLKELKPALVYSNYTKIDNNYLFIIEDIFDDFSYQINNRVAGCINQLFHNENDEESKETSEILVRLINSFYIDKQENSSKDNEVNSDLNQISLFDDEVLAEEQEPFEQDLNILKKN